MHSALGLSATEDTVSAVLVDVDDDAGSISEIEERSVELAAAGSGAVGDAVAAAIGVMKLRAARGELPVGVVGVAYESERQRSAIEHAISTQGISGVRMIWSHSPILDRELDVATAAAVWAAGEARASGGFDDGAMTVVIPVPIAVPPLVSKWRNIPRSVVVAAVAATVLGGSVASAIALGALGNSDDRVVQAGAATEAPSAPATSVRSTTVASSSVTVSAAPAPEVDETTVDYVPPARPQSQAEPMPPAPVAVPEASASAPAESAPQARTDSSSPTTTARVPAVTAPSGNTAGSGGGGGSGRPTSTTVPPSPTTAPPTSTPDESTTTITVTSAPADDDDHDHP